MENKSLKSDLKIQAYFKGFKKVKKVSKDSRNSKKFKDGKQRFKKCQEGLKRF